MRQFPPANCLLETLPTEIHKRLCSALVYLPLALGDVIYEPGERLELCLFSDQLVVS